MRLYAGDEEFFTVLLYESCKHGCRWRDHTLKGFLAMRTRLVVFHFGAVLRLLQAWLVDTTRESRAARLSTLGLPSGGRGSSWQDDSSQRMR